MKFAGMVTFYNPSKENINNILKYIDGLDKLYIVDNSSINNLDLIPKNPKLKYLPNCDNLGIARALNIASLKAINDGYKWLLTMDQDSELTLDVLNKLKDFVLNNNTSNIGIISPYHDIVTHEKKNNIAIEEVDTVMTSGNLLNLDIYMKIGGFKDWFFIDNVDLEYCLNLKKNGYKVIRLNNVIMKHNLGNVSIHKFFGKKCICSNHNAIRRYYMIRNLFYLNDLYGNDFKEYCKFLFNNQKGQVKYVIFFEKDKINKLKMMYKGYRDYKKGKKGRIDKLVLKG